MMPSDSKKTILLWLSASCAMVFLMVVVGGITRLTESGLSMTEWRPVTGWLPPLSTEEWERVYNLYRDSPEFLHKHHWMEIEDFKKIFFWEWFHRLLGRLTGLVYALPLLWFAFRRALPEGFKSRLFFLLLLGAGQGLMGWIMVQSGLVDRPSVSHYRLAAHLGLALILFGALIWTILEIQLGKLAKTPSALSITSLALLSITMLWGAFTAGLDAGLIYNTFPLMDGHFFPPEPFKSLSLLEDHAWVQFTHRWLAAGTAASCLWLAWQEKDRLLALTVFLQVGLGIKTLLTGVWIVPAVSHQAGAAILLAALLRRMYLSTQFPGKSRDKPLHTAPS